ncbi:MAG: flagellar basal body P-ring formation protein FlgA [Desulfovibrionaceae bacterium]|jgi:flagella basal body P-ring formation protein FlgA|nr:flagellar basal body P-ring formation protein FlgA [Desulfovibrionaceae bacterium]
MFAGNGRDGAGRARTTAAAAVFSGVLLFALAWSALAEAQQVQQVQQTPWRIRIKEAAVVVGERVLLGEIAEPVGEMRPEEWRALASKQLWSSPPAGGRPMAVNRDKLAAALEHYLGKTSALCLMPLRMVLARGGRVLLEHELRNLAVKELTPKLPALGGEASLRDFRLPPYLFLDDATQKVCVELPSGLRAGSTPLVLMVRTLDGREAGSISAGVFVDVWRTVPAAGRPLNHGDSVTPDALTQVRKNEAYLRGEIWDGRGGPWRVKRPVGAGQVLYRDNLEPVPMVSRGDKVVMVFKGAHIRLEAQGEAMADGSPGDHIPVRNLQSRRQVYARVVDSGTVSVQ